jgi:NADH-quinone oxidoreductase subunit N
MDIQVVMPEIFLSVTAMAILLLGTFVGERGKMWPGYLALAALAATALLLNRLGGEGRVLAYSGMFMSDGFAVIFKMMFILAGILTTLVSHDFLRARGVPGGEFHALLLFAIVGMLIASAYDFMTLFIGIELTSLSTYILVGLTKKDLWSNEAAIKYFLLSIMASAVLLFGISIVYAAVGTTNFGQVHDRMGELAVRAPGVAISALVFLAVGFGFKITAAPFHMYAPDVYQGAPTPVTIFLSVGPKAAAFAGLARTLEAVAHPIAADWLTLMSVLAVLTMTVGNVAAIAQRNVKRMLAYSSIAHSGYVLIGIAAMAAAGGADSGAPSAAASVVFYLFAYTIMNVGAFSLLMYMRRGDGYGEDLRDFSGLARRRPAVAAAMLVFLLSLAGIPPTVGFFGKFYIFMAAINAKMYIVAAAGVVNVVISLFYYARIVVHMFMKEPEAGVADVGSAPLHAAILFSAVATIVLGVFPQTLLVAIESATAVIVTGGIVP